jgi:hypothetical protein
MFFRAPMRIFFRCAKFRRKRHSGNVSSEKFRAAQQKWCVLQVNHTKGDFEICHPHLQENRMHTGASSVQEIVIHKMDFL